MIMTRAIIGCIRLTLGLSLIAIAFTSTASAQAFRTFVSGFGNDANFCTLTQPCRTFSGAISKTAPGGELVALTSAGYGTVTIPKSLTIEAAPGVHAGIAVAGGDGVTVNAGPNDQVALRGLIINGIGSRGAHGINATSVGQLHVEGCLIFGFSDPFAGAGILMGVTGASRLSVKDTLIRQNGIALEISNSSPADTVLATVDHCRLEDNLSGVLTFGQCTASIRDSLVSRNTTGFRINTNGAVAIVYVTNCLIDSNGGAMILGATGPNSLAAAYFSGDSIINNLSDFSRSGGTQLVSYGGNVILDPGPVAGGPSPFDLTVPTH
jgi:hypothetical protein